jgi:undecaprenyl-diphosphatase
MDFTKSLVLAIVQGVTEFLPVSSTGHINLLQHLFGLTPSLTLDIFLNTASLIAVLFYFKDKTSYFFSNLKYIIVGTIPAVIAGLLFRDQIEAIFSSTQTLPYEFLITAITLFLTKRFTNQNCALSYRKALVIGLFQAMAIIPAISRSGSTIFAGLLLGLSPIEAFNFSFGLFIPASIGALILSLKDMALTNIFTTTNLVSFGATTITSLVALRFLQQVLVGRNLWKFGYYCLVMGLILLTFGY